MENFKKLNEELDNFLNEDVFPLYEMSMAWFYKNRRIDVCAWVENPLSVDNRYFKYYNSSTLNNATKVARIRMDKPVYVGGIHKERNLEKWILSKKEIKELINILKSPSQEFNNLTYWQQILYTYNRDNFALTLKQTINGDFSEINKDPKMPKYIQPFPLDYPMPDYTELIMEL